MRVRASRLPLIPFVIAAAFLLATLVPSERAVHAQAGTAIEASHLGGLTLRTVGPANMSGRIVDLAVVESNPFVIYAATATGGLWKTTDNGVTWAPVFEHEAVHSLGVVTVDQANPNNVWVGTGEAANRQSAGWGDGVYKSTDAGTTWTNMGLRDSKHIGRIVLHPQNSDIVYVAVTGHLWGSNPERGLYKSANGGTTWTRVLGINDDTGVTDVAMDPSDPSVLYAAAYQRRRAAFGFDGGGPGSGLYKSTDGGATWRQLTAGLPAGDTGRIGISIYRTDPRIVYVSVEQGERYNASTAYEQRKAGVYRSDDKGETWTHMSDWNPRPMYASQIRVDPNDDRRIYMMNAYSFSDDGGKTFTAARQTLHGDDRVVWINPRDSRHVIKGDDGGVGISYDRGLKWLYVSSLPVSQFYRIDADMRKPYWLYGGLQDNGSWAGPSATYTSWGILNEHWQRTGGGDGFFNVIDRTNNRTLYTASQYLGLSRLDLVSGERVDIRPDQPKGFIQARRNWANWGRPDVAEPPIGNAMAPANWDAPIIISPHDARTLYAGTNTLWKSTNRGDTWVSLGDRTTGVDRSTLPLMNQTPTRDTLSLDDGIPYYPTITAIAESSKVKGLLYVGTDDGNVQVTEDDGKTWRDTASTLPGLPTSAWIGGIEASRHDANVVYLASDNHRSDDYRNHLYRSGDRGRTWASIVGNLPADRVVRTVREDPKNPDVLYIGTEFGLFVSLDRGVRWVELRNNMPRVAINDLMIHPRDNDLVLATHGRGIWILDNVSALQELTSSVVSAGAGLFSIRPADMIRYTQPKAHAGDMIFRGENPPAGAIIDYYLGRADAQVTLSVHDGTGALVTEITPATVRGVNRVIWNLRHPQVAAATRRGGDDDEEGGGGGLPGPFVVPGAYTVTLMVDGKAFTQTVQVSEDPRINVAPAVRAEWTAILLTIGDMHRGASALVEAARKNPDSASATSRERVRVTRELQMRIGTLYRAVSASTGPLTSDQRQQMTFLDETRARLAAQATTGANP